MAVTCGTPTPITPRVVQAEPGPIPIKRPLIPVAITCDPPTLMKGQPWYRVPDRPMQFTLDVGVPIWPADWRNVAVPEALTARRVTGAMRRHYERSLSRAGA